MSLNTILNEITANRPNAELNVELGNPATLGGRLGLKRAATEALKRLRIQYRNELMSSTVFIVVTGSESDAFSALSSGDTFGCFSSDPEDFYKDLTSRISPSLFGREGVRQLFNIAGNVLEDKAMELDLVSYPMLMFSEKYNSAVNSAEDFLPIIRNAINDQVGSEIVGINAINAITDNAINKNHTATVTPVVLNTSDENFALNLHNNLKRRRNSDGTLSGLTDKVFLVVAGKASKVLRGTKEALLVKTVSEESVGEALASIRSKILQ